MVSGGGDVTIRLWDVQSGCVKKEFYGHSNSVNCVAIINDSFFISGSVDSTLKIWKKESSEEIYTIKPKSI